MHLRLGHRILDLSTPKVMGVLNVTPDSFSDGGHFTRLEAAMEQAEQMVAAGASIIDVGGESTRPCSEPVAGETELDRVLHVIEAIAESLDLAVSVQPDKPDVQRQA